MQPQDKSESAPYVLTLCLEKDRHNASSFSTLACQDDIKQDIVIVSAVPLNIHDGFGDRYENFVVPVDPKLPLQYRIAVTVNAAIKKYYKPEHTHILKFDGGDTWLSSDYLVRAIAEKKAVVGVGGMLISSDFFRRYMKCKYPYNLYDDGYIRALAWVTCQNSILMEQSVPYGVIATRSASNGRSYNTAYMLRLMGHPMFLLVIGMIIKWFKIKATQNEDQPIRFTHIIHSIAGYASSWVNRKKKYSWAPIYTHKLLKYHMGFRNGNGNGNGNCNDNGNVNANGKTNGTHC